MNRVYCRAPFGWSHLICTSLYHVILAIGWGRRILAADPWKRKESWLSRQKWHSEMHDLSFNNSHACKNKEGIVSWRRKSYHKLLMVQPAVGWRVWCVHASEVRDEMEGMDQMGWGYYSLFSKCIGNTLILWKSRIWEAQYRALLSQGLREHLKICHV